MPFHLGQFSISLYYKVCNSEIEAALRLLSESLKCEVKTSVLASSRWAPRRPLVSDVISTFGSPDIYTPHPVSIIIIKDRRIEAPGEIAKMSGKK